jgi:hypothetical protein
MWHLPRTGNIPAGRLRICFAIAAINKFNVPRTGAMARQAATRWLLATHAGKWMAPSLSYLWAVPKIFRTPRSEEKEHAPMPLDEKTRTELEAAAFRRLLEHLRARTDVQNIDLMNLAGFCRNCLSNWMKDAADAKGLPMSKDESREIVYGEPYDDWRKKHQKEASPDQKAAFEKSSPKH